MDRATGSFWDRAERGLDLGVAGEPTRRAKRQAVLTDVQSTAYKANRGHLSTSTKTSGFPRTRQPSPIERSMVVCPVCNFQVPLHWINTHLDLQCSTASRVAMSTDRSGPCQQTAPSTAVPDGRSTRSIDAQPLTVRGCTDLQVHPAAALEPGALWEVPRRGPGGVLANKEADKAVHADLGQHEGHGRVPGLLCISTSAGSTGADDDGLVTDVRAGTAGALPVQRSQSAAPFPPVFALTSVLLPAPPRAAAAAPLSPSVAPSSVSDNLDGCTAASAEQLPCNLPYCPPLGQLRGPAHVLYQGAGLHQPPRTPNGVRQRGHTPTSHDQQGFNLLVGGAAGACDPGDGKDGYGTTCDPTGAEGRGPPGLCPGSAMWLSSGRTGQDEARQGTKISSGGGDLSLKDAACRGHHEEKAADAGRPVAGPLPAASGDAPSRIPAQRVHPMFLPRAAKRCRLSGLGERGCARAEAGAASSADGRMLLKPFGGSCRVDDDDRDEWATTEGEAGGYDAGRPQKAFRLPAAPGAVEPLAMLPTTRHPVLEGQFVVAGFVSEQEEAELLAMCDDPTLKPTWSSWTGQSFANATAQKTRGKRWGVLPDYHRRGVAPAEHPLPPLLRLLVERMRTRVPLLRGFDPNEANAIDYMRSRASWLRPHVDDRILSGEIIVNLSLAGAAIMTFARDKPTAPSAAKQQQQQAAAGGTAHARDCFRVRLERRSLQILSKAARYSYSHAISPGDLLDDRRVSITFRRSELRGFEKG